MEQLLGVDISNLNRFDPSLQTVEPRDQIWMTPGTAFWLVGTLLMERGMLRSIKARADLSAATIEAHSAVEGYPASTTMPEWSPHPGLENADQ